MSKTVEVDDNLIEQAVEAGKHASRSDAANAAPAEYVRRRKRTGIIEMFGKVDYWPDYDPKEGRRKR